MAQEKHASFMNPFRALYLRCVEKEKKSNLVSSPKELFHPQCRQSTPTQLNSPKLQLLKALHSFALAINSLPNDVPTKAFGLFSK